MAAHPSAAQGDDGADRSVRVTVPARLADQAGAILMDVLGSFEEEQVASDRPGPDERSTLVFYPPADGPSSREEVLALLPGDFAEPGVLDVQTGSVSREWVEGWRAHFRPIVIGAVRIRPPWEPRLGEEGQGLIDVVINPGLGFGTGLHPTTRGTLLLLQQGAAAAEGAVPVEGGAGRGPLVDVGTGSGILAIAAAKLGWVPVMALDNDPVALMSARENVAANGVQNQVEIYEMDSGAADARWFQDATVLANMTLEPLSVLMRRFARDAVRPSRLVVSGILAGSQEEQLLLTAHESGFAPGRALYEDEWVTLELLAEGAVG